VPISYHGRTVAEGKKIGWTDAVSALWTLLKFRFVDDRFTTHEGYYILANMRRARALNRWIFDQFRSSVGARVLEAGCGIGNFSELLLDRERLVAVDNDPFYAEMLTWRLGHLENVRTMRFDVSDPSAYAAVASERVDTVVCQNVLEDAEQDEPLLRAFHGVLEPGGHLIVLVPAHASLYGPADEALGHKRRYSQTELHTKIQNAGFDVVRIEEFNRLGTLGWWWNKQLGRRQISSRQLRAFAWMLPIAKAAEAMKIGRGLGLVAVARRR
jgi:SAM-dependent methyltransferase